MHKHINKKIPRAMTIPRTTGLMASTGDKPSVPVTAITPAVGEGEGMKWSKKQEHGKEGY